MLFYTHTHTHLYTITTDTALTCRQRSSSGKLVCHTTFFLQSSKFFFLPFFYSSPTDTYIHFHFLLLFSLSLSISSLSLRLYASSSDDFWIRRRHTEAFLLLNSIFFSRVCTHKCDEKTVYVCVLCRA